MINFKNSILFFLLFIVLVHCTHSKEKSIDLEKVKNELRALEAAHQDSVAKHGFEKSLLFFASPDFVLMQDAKFITVYKVYNSYITL